MEEFLTTDGAMNILKSANCWGEQNCFFVTFKNTNREGVKYGVAGALGGAIGGAVAGAIDGMSKSLAGLYYDGLLINQTENGLGIVPLVNQGVALMLNPAKMKANVQTSFFVNYDDIASIVIKNFNIFNSKTKKITIKLKSDVTFYLLAHVQEKQISYQEANLAQFMEKWSSAK